MATFIRGSNPLWIFRDLVGQPLNDEYYISFLSNTFPYLPSLVYRDNQAAVPWADPLQLLPNGGLPDNIYFQEDLVYRLEIRHGATQNDQLINTIMNYVPGSSGGNNSTDTGTQNNQITNPQFAFINFVSPLTIAVSGTYSIAPGWDLVLTGTGTVTITQLVFTGAQNLLQTNPNQPNSVPPYALRFNTNGWITAILRQRFSGVGAIWYNNYVSASIFTRSDSGGGLISVNYVPNAGTGGVPVPIISNVALTTEASYAIVEGVVALNSSANTSLNNVANVDIQIVLPPTGITDIGDIQVMGQNVLLPLNFAVTPDETLERQTDHLFHYYANSLIIQPKKSLLVGWNFPLNPYQFIAAAAANVATQTSYIADQTILHQEAASQLAAGQVSYTERHGLLVAPQAATTTTRFAIIQYIDPSSIRQYWGYLVSALVRAKMFSPTHSTQVRIKMRLIWRTDAVPTISATEPINGWDVNSDVTFAAGWTVLKPLNDPAYIVSGSYLAGTNSGYPAYAFDQFSLPAPTGANQVLGIVLYTQDALNSGATADNLVFDTISLARNDFAIDTHPQTFDECLRECQFYYEKTYDNANVPGTVTGNGGLVREQAAIDVGGNVSFIARTFGLEYNSVKRAAPTITFYAVDSTINVVTGLLYNAGAAIASGNIAITGGGKVWTSSQISTKSATYYANDIGGKLVTTVGGNQPEGAINFQCTMDARLGL